MIEDLLSHQNIEFVEVDGKQIYLVGTAHVSRESVELAEKLIREVRPDSVAIELCESRFASLRDPERWRKTDILTVIREGRAFVLVIQILLASYQKKLGKLLQVKPGEEMMAAAAAGEECGSQIVLADREVKITLKRTLRNIRLRTIFRLFGSWLHSLFEPHEMKKEDIERLKSPDVLDELMEELARELPEVRESLITERDIYLSQKIKSSPGSRIVAVLGTGHIGGVKKWLDKNVDISHLEKLPPRGPVRRVFRWAILSLFIIALLYAFISAGAAKGFALLTSWFWVTAIGAALGAFLVLGHPITILSAFISAPFTTFPPLLGAGWVAGLTEAWLRKPRVEDFEKIIDDAASVKGIWTNRVTRILLIMALANIGSALGAAWGAKIIISLL